MVATLFGVESKPEPHALGLSKKQRCAIEAEVRHGWPKESRFYDLKAGEYIWVPWPGRTAALKVAQAAGVSIRQIYNWRKSDDYRRALMQRLADNLTASVEQSDDEEEQKYLRLKLEIEKHGQGPFTAPVSKGSGPKVFDTSAQYARYLVEQDFDLRTKLLEELVKK